MAGYTRQSVADIVDGEDIIAAPLNNEFNAIQAAMHATTGHTHDASAGNGPKLVLTAAASVSGTLPLANGGTNAVLADPNADRIMFWDDSAGAVTWLTASTGLAITTTNLTMSFLGLETLTDPNADSILFWDDSAGSFAWLTLPTGLTFSGTGIALANDLAALEGLSSTGLVTRTASETYVERTITGTAAEITVTNGNGVSGNPTLSLPTSLTFTGKTITGGAYTGATINNTVIGGSTAAAGSFTTIAASSTLTGAGATFSSATVTGTASATGLLAAVGSAGTGWVLAAYDDSPAADSNRLFGADRANNTVVIGQGASGGFVPYANDGISLGTTSLRWSDLHLASGAVINFNSDVLLTHSTDLLAMTGGTFQSHGPTSNYGIRGYSTDVNYGGVIGFAQNGSTYGILGYANSYSLYGNAAGYLFDSLSIESADAGAGTGPQLVLNRTSASPAVSDFIGYIAFSGRDSGGNGATYADILSQILDPTNGSEDGQLIIRTMTAGSQEYCATFRGGGIQGTIGNVTPGIGTFTTLLSTTLAVNNTGGGPAANINVLADGSVVELAQGGATEGTISISGTTCTYGTFFGSHWSQPLTDGDRKNALRGTIVESVSEMCFWEDETNQHLPKFQISNTPQSKRVYGVFAWWDDDDDAFIGALGTYMIRIAKGEVVEGGDLIESNGDGCGRVQADDLMRSSTVAKITSTEIIETYEDGSYLVPCTLHCG